MSVCGKIKTEKYQTCRVGEVEGHVPVGGQEVLVLAERQCRIGE
jgi:hypothetical protein